MSKDSKFLIKSGVNITIKDIADGYSKEKVRSSTLIKHLQTVYDQQVEIENMLLREKKWCPPLPNHVPLALNFKELDKYLSKKNKPDMHKMMNARALEALACVANNIIALDSPAARSHAALLRKFFTGIRLMGAPSQRGYAMSSDMADHVNEAFVIKVERGESDTHSKYSMRHEVVVGLILNQLRSIIPNFAYVFGSFECGGPILTLKDVDPSKSMPDIVSVRPEKFEPKVTSWCRGGEIQTYAIYENINKSITLKDYVKTCNSQQFMDITVQIMYALKIAFERVGFTHYDLHAENVLIRDVDRDAFYIAYEGDAVFASRIATIIDYGFSHVYYHDPASGRNISLGIKEPGGSRGNLSMLKYGVYMDTPNPIVDCYRILWYMLEATSRYNKPVYNEMKELIRFFHKEDSYDYIFINPPADVYGILPSFGTKVLTEQSAKFNYSDFIRFCREYCIYKSLLDPVVRTQDLPEESKLDILSNKMVGFNNPVFTEDTDTVKITNAEELYDLFEPIAVKAEDIRHRIIESSSESTKKKLQTSLDDLTVVFGRLKKSYLPRVPGMLADFVEDLNSQIADLRPVEYLKIPEKDFLSIFEPEIFSKLNVQLRLLSLHLDKMDSISNNFGIVENLKLFFDIDDRSREYTVDEETFRKMDSRRKIKDYITADLAVLRRNFKEYDLERFQHLGDVLIHGYSNMF